MSTLCTGRLHPPGGIPGTHFCQRLSQFQGHSAAGRIKSVRNPKDHATLRLAAKCLNQLCRRVPLSLQLSLSYSHPVYPSVHANFGSDKQEISSVSDKQFGPVVIGPRQVVAGRVGRKEKLLSVIIPTIHAV